MKVAIIDYGVGNTQSIKNAFKFCGVESVTLTNKVAQIKEADLIVFPGVGAFNDAMNMIKSSSLLDCLNKLIFEEKKPIFGVCLGMQLFFSHSFESGVKTEGLGWLEGSVNYFQKVDVDRVPHVGWNSIFKSSSSKFNNFRILESDFYFSHSLIVDCDKSLVLAKCNYGINFPAIVRKENIFGVQFHPEKSNKNGLKFLELALHQIFKRVI